MEKKHHHNHEGCCHGHSHEDGCCSHDHSCASGEGCSSHSCDSNCHDHHDDFAHMLLELADEAWTEVLKDKIKKQIESSKDDHMEQLARLVAEGNHERWKQKIAANRLQREFKKKVHDIF